MDLDPPNYLVPVCDITSYNNEESITLLFRKELMIVTTKLEKMKIFNQSWEGLNLSQITNSIIKESRPAYHADVKRTLKGKKKYKTRGKLLILRSKIQHYNAVARTSGKYSPRPILGVTFEDFYKQILYTQREHNNLAKSNFTNSINSNTEVPFNEKIKDEDDITEITETEAFLSEVKQDEVTIMDTAPLINEMEKETDDIINISSNDSSDIEYTIPFCRIYKDIHVDIDKNASAAVNTFPSLPDKSAANLPKILTVEHGTSMEHHYSGDALHLVWSKTREEDAYFLASGKLFSYRKEFFCHNYALKLMYCCYFKMKNIIEGLNLNPHSDLYCFLKKPHGCKTGLCNCCHSEELALPIESALKKNKIYNDNRLTNDIWLSYLLNKDFFKERSFETTDVFYNKVMHYIPKTIINKSAAKKEVKSCDSKKKSDILQVLLTYKNVILKQTNIHVEVFYVSNKQYIFDHALYKRPKVIMNSKNSYNQTICCSIKRQQYLNDFVTGNILQPEAVESMKSPHYCIQNNNTCVCCCKPLLKRKESGIKIKKIVKPNTQKPDKIWEEVEITNEKTLDKYSKEITDIGAPISEKSNIYKELNTIIKQNLADINNFKFSVNNEGKLLAVFTSAVSEIAHIKAIHGVLATASARIASLGIPPQEFCETINAYMKKMQILTKCSKLMAEKHKQYTKSFTSMFDVSEPLPGMENVNIAKVVSLSEHRNAQHKKLPNKRLNKATTKSKVSKRAKTSSEPKKEVAKPNEALNSNTLSNQTFHLKVQRQEPAKTPNESNPILRNLLKDFRKKPSISTKQIEMETTPVLVHTPNILSRNAGNTTNVRAASTLVNTTPAQHLYNNPSTSNLQNNLNDFVSSKTPPLPTIPPIPPLPTLPPLPTNDLPIYTVLNMAGPSSAKPVILHSDDEEDDSILGW